ncbi:MAG: hypothetical protein A2469_00540 [Candidatus Magasanikbacteria bacterium RIFOXYC2_FULL_40_16]|uniref:Succinylglutamate desuccinylase/Aspartoacylase catalytic domain-containing protein n=2 Tax=Candidatus Magasanikiibacteriota TaxID=1752731 RepID=A0A1F6NHW1_9BACT|nr:MAG: hypothetical protein A2224_00465 [Candidatus Magasanikbacteria bacterium RIFOXYA2_FULL_40_20]OGH83384.1 MAG: hypothetical protein A2373_00225 [Candidatus Magasanikbacteria bacterium RIFOXYB1_FULL_40_15]OGH90094.1 MAG: hypothetical protein A2469_00540 [Candidatus Magasanikbacteria bacterium RIFOXYC2_FULL_40_16]
MNEKIEPFHKLMKDLSNRVDIEIDEKNLAYKKGSFPFFRIASKNISPTDKVVLIRAGIHGDEISGPLTILRHASQIIDYAHANGVKLIIYPIGNPSGYALGLRYNIDNENYGCGNNDFLRYELEDGRLVDDLGKNPQPFTRWFWSSEVAGVSLPLETAVMHKYLREIAPLKQIRAVIDLHQDYLTPGAEPSAYFYPFGELSDYLPLVEKARTVTPILNNSPIGAGFQTKIDAQGKVIKSGAGEQDMFTDDDGFIVRYDGSLTDLFWRLGAKYCVAVETTGATPLDDAIQVNLIWILGLIDLTAREK